MSKGGKLHGFITVAEGLRNVYEPTYVKYRNKKHQIIKIPQIKITSVTYDVKIEHRDAPTDADLPELLEVKAGDTVTLPELTGYRAKWTDKNGAVYEPSKIEGNLNLIATWKKDKENEKENDKEPSEDIGEIYYKELTDEDVEIDQETGISYVKNQVLISAYQGIDKSIIEDIVEEVGGRIVGYIELTNDYQVEFGENKTMEELNRMIEYINGFSFINTVTLNTASEMELSSFGSNDEIYNDNKRTDENPDHPGTWQEEKWDEDNPKGDNWGLEALKVPSAWKYKSLFKPVKVGVYDAAFARHKDLSYKRIYNNNQDRDLSKYPPGEREERRAAIESNITHGTHVSGILAASHHNNLGISGIATETELYAYGVGGKRYSGMMAKKIGFATLIGNRVKVINISRNYISEITIAANHPEIPEFKEYSDKARRIIKLEAGIMQEFLKKFVDAGYDFVICVSAGNNNSALFATDKNENFGVRLIKRNGRSNPEEKIYSVSNDTINSSDLIAIRDSESGIEDRIIVVGSILKEENKEYEVAKTSNYGKRVDFVAPGVDIASTVPRNQYALNSGTSMASPHVASIVAMMYQINPNLDGAKIKNIMKDCAKHEVRQKVEIDGEEKEFPYKIPDALECCKRAMNVSRSETDKEKEKKKGVLTGKVESSSGKVLSKVWIKAMREGREFFNVPYFTLTDAQGAYTMILPEGLYEISFFPNNKTETHYKNICGHKEYVWIGRDKTMILDIALPEWEKNKKYVLSGTIMYSDGPGKWEVPVEGITLKVRKKNQGGKPFVKDLSGNILQTTTDENGKFFIPVKPGVYEVVAYRDTTTRGYMTMTSRDMDSYKKFDKEYYLFPLFDLR